ncbi:MAG: zinc ribbon domain-containing protein [Lachnospiraceae bacterium]|nr:zinc ribbon domain-containing protein [Lachnospiraceae bacterium]
MKIICPACGKETEGGFMFCMNCGSKIGEAAAVKAAEEADALIEKAEEAAEEVSEAVDETVAEAAETVEAAVPEILEPVNEVFTPVNAFAETASDVKETVTEAAEKAESVADNIVPEPAAAPVQPAPAQPAAPVQPAPVQPAQPTAPTYGAGVYGAATVAVFPPSGTEQTSNATQNVQQNYSQTYQQPYSQQYQQPYAQQYQQNAQYNGQYQTPYSTPYAAPMRAVKPEKEKKSLGAGRRVLAFLLCIFLFGCGLVSLLVFGIRKAFSPENLMEAVTDTSVITKMDVADLTGSEADRGKSVAEYIIEQIPEEQRALYPELNEKNLEMLLKDKEVKKLISGVVDGAVDFLTGEEDEFAVDADKIVSVLEDKADVIEEYTGKKLKKEDYDAIRDGIEEFNEEQASQLTRNGGDGFETGMKIIRFFFSDKLLYIMYGITGFFALLILLACGRFVDSGLIHIGVTGALVGGLVFGGVTLGQNMFEEFAEDHLSTVYISMIQDAVFRHFDRAGLVVLFAGIGLIIVGVVWKVVRFSVSE